jgi:hypothetical protein
MRLPITAFSSSGSGGSSSSGITIGTTTITSGTDTRVLFDDAGTVGESAGLTYVKGTGTLVATLVNPTGITITSTTGVIVLSNNTNTNSATQDMIRLGADNFAIRQHFGAAFAISGGNKFWMSTASFGLSSDKPIVWDSSTIVTGNTPDTGLNRAAAGIVSITNGSSGFGQVRIGANTTATMTQETAGQLRTVTESYTWTNAQVVALGASLTGDIKVCTLPAKTVVKNAYIVILTAAGTVTTLTVALGRVSASYIDYIVASDAKAAANTVYGDASAERGTNLTGYDLPSYTGTTDVFCHFISTVQNLSSTTTSTGRVVIETVVVP